MWLVVLISSLLFLSCPSCSTCPLSCPHVSSPVCGSDGVTYSNVCRLLSSSCLSGADLSVLYPGTCSCPSSCPQLALDPVCGENEDGTVDQFASRCHLQAAACADGRRLREMGCPQEFRTEKGIYIGEFVI